MDVAVSRRNARAAKPVPRKFLRLCGTIRRVISCKACAARRSAYTCSPTRGTIDRRQCRHRHYIALAAPALRSAAAAGVCSAVAAGALGAAGATSLGGTIGAPIGALGATGETTTGAGGGRTAGGACSPASRVGHRRHRSRQPVEPQQDTAKGNDQHRAIDRKPHRFAPASDRAYVEQPNPTLERRTANIEALPAHGRR